MDSTSIFLGMNNIVIAGLFIVMAIPLVSHKVGMNRVFGIRLKRAFESEENWYKINEYGGKQLIIWSIVLALIGIVTFFIPLKDNMVLITLVASAPLIVIVAAIKSWLYARRI